MTDPVSKTLTGVVRTSKKPPNQECTCRVPRSRATAPWWASTSLARGAKFPTPLLQNAELSAMATHPVVEFCSWETPHNPARTQSPRLGECGAKGAAGCDNKVILICPSCVLGHSHMQILSCSTVFVHLQSPSVIQICVLLSYNTLV